MRRRRLKMICIRWPPIDSNDFHGRFKPSKYRLVSARYKGKRRPLIQGRAPLETMKRARIGSPEQIRASQGPTWQSDGGREGGREGEGG